MAGEQSARRAGATARRRHGAQVPWRAGAIAGEHETAGDGVNLTLEHKLCWRKTDFDICVRKATSQVRIVSIILNSINEFHVLTFSAWWYQIAEIDKTFQNCRTKTCIF